MAVTLEQARIAVATKIDSLVATWSAYTLAVEWSNRNSINYGTQVNPFLCAELMMIDGYRSTLGSALSHRVMGSIILTARVRRGQGTKPANDLLEHFYPTMQMTDSMSPVRTHAARLVTAKPEQDWLGVSAVIPFWYDS